MEKYEIEKLRNLPIESVAERLGLRVSHHKALCPFHHDTNPSLSFHVGRNTYKCFVCDAHGGTIDLTMKVLGCSFIDACNWLANEHNIIITEFKPMPKAKPQPPDTEYLECLMRRPALNEAARHFLFEERRLNPKAIEWCGITSISTPTPCWRYGKPFYDAPSLLFPYKDINGNIMNVQSRYLGNKTGTPRFRFPPNGTIRIFNLPILRHLKSGEPLFITEGITDCLSLLSSGHKAIAIPSATLMNPQDLSILGTLGQRLGTTFHIYPDRDEAGERLYHQLVKESLSLGILLVRHDLPSDCKDYSDFYLKQQIR